MTQGTESRYSRQARFAPVGDAGQRRIREAAVAIVGCGALGTVEAEILARAGVGRLRLIDRDFIEWSNLQRQFLYSEADAVEALPKAAAAAKRIAAINSDVLVEPFVADLIPANAEELLEEVDLIVDGSDNFEVRFLINDFAVREGIPWIYAAAVGSYGLKLPIIPGNTACLRCVYPEAPQGVQPTCETEGVLAPITATIAALACGDALKFLVGGESPVISRFTTVDVWSGEIRQTKPPARDPECACCVQRNFIHLNGQRRAPISLCGRNAVQIHERSRPIDLAELAQRLAMLAPVRRNDFAVRAMIESFELTVFPDGRAIIKGTTDPGVARSVYARYVGM